MVHQHEVDALASCSRHCHTSAHTFSEMVSLGAAQVDVGVDVAGFIEKSEQHAGPSQSCMRQAAARVVATTLRSSASSAAVPHMMHKAKRACMRSSSL